MTVANYDVKKILIDNESSVDVLFYDVLSKINLSGRLKQVNTPLIGFSSNPVAIEGEITLSITVGQEPRQSTVWLIFLIVKVSSAYNTILGRPDLNALKAIVSIYHLLVWFLIKKEIGEMHGDQIVAQ